MSEATTLRLMPIYDVPCGNNEVRSGWLHYCRKRGYMADLTDQRNTF